MTQTSQQNVITFRKASSAPSGADDPIMTEKGRHIAALAENARTEHKILTALQHVKPTAYAVKETSDAYEVGIATEQERSAFQTAFAQVSDTISYSMGPEDSEPQFAQDVKLLKTSGLLDIKTPKTDPSILHIYTPGG